MDFRNASIPAEKVTSTDVNKAIQRSLTKACARHGLGLYIYAGEDLPESAQGLDQTDPKPEKPNPAAARLAARAECQRAVKAYCQNNNADENDAWKLIADTIGKPSKDFTAEDWKQGQQIAEAWK